MNVLHMLLAAFGIGLLIFVHELGHFLAARWAGVRVDVFSLGFGPRLGGFRWRGTDFRLSLVPFGGYVMAAGTDPGDRRHPREVSLWAKPIGKRALFWSGGVLMNVLFALIAFPIVFSVGVSFTAPIVGIVRQGEPAWEAGIEPGDRILAVRGKEILSFESFRIEIALHGGRPLPLEIEREGRKRTVTVTPRYDTASGLFALGIGPEFSDVRLRVEETGPAVKAGLRPTDHIVRIQGEPILEAEEWLAAQARGEPLTITVERGGEPLDLEIASPVPGQPSPPRIGVQALRRKVLGLRDRDGLLARLGLERGDVILGIDGRPFLDGDLDTLREGSSPLRLIVARNGVLKRLEAPVLPAERAELPARIVLAADESMRLFPVPGAAARAAGMLPGDLVESVDGEPVTDWESLRKVVEAAGDRTLSVTVRRTPGAGGDWLDESAAELRTGERVVLSIAPRRQPVWDYGFALSFGPTQTEVRADGVGDALRLGTVCSLDLIKQAYVTLKRMVTGEIGAKNLSGIVRISESSYRAAERGPSWFWYFLGLISLNLAFVNVLPIPILDGGHLLFLLIEKVKGSPVSSRVFGYSQVIGLVFVLLLVVFVTYNDIMRYL